MSQIITIDCDNVLADTAGAFVHWYISETWRELDVSQLDTQYLSGATPLQWLVEKIGDPYYPFWKDILDPGKVCDIMPMDWAVEWVRQLVNAGYTLQVVTGRWSMEQQETYRWLEYWFWWAFDKVIFGHEGSDDYTDKWQLCSWLWASVHLDDFIQNARDIAKTGIPTLLFDRRWNQSDESHALIQRVKWREDSVDRIVKNVLN